MTEWRLFKQFGDLGRNVLVHALTAHCLGVYSAQLCAARCLSSSPRSFPFSVLELLREQQLLRGPALAGAAAPAERKDNTEWGWLTGALNLLYYKRELQLPEAARHDPCVKFHLGLLAFSGHLALPQACCLTRGWEFWTIPPGHLGGFCLSRWGPNQCFLGKSGCPVCAFSTVLFLTTVVFAGLQDKPAHERGGEVKWVWALWSLFGFSFAIGSFRKVLRAGRDILLPRNGAWETFLWSVWAGRKQVYPAASCFVSGVKCDPEWPETGGQCQRSKRRG